MSQRGAIFGAVLGVGLAIAAAPAVASDDYVFKPFAALTYSTPMDSSSARLGTEVAEIELSDESGWEAGLEWRFGKFLGIEASYGRSEHEIRFGGARLGDATFEPIYLALDFHIFARERFDLWVAPTVVFVNWKEENLQRGLEEGDTSDTGFGVTVGADWLLGETFALTGGVRYVDAQIGLGPKGSVAVDPLTFRFGVAAKL